MSESPSGDSQQIWVSLISVFYNNYYKTAKAQKSFNKVCKVVCMYAIVPWLITCKWHVKIKRCTKL